MITDTETLEVVEEAQAEVERLLASLWEEPDLSAKSARLSPVYVILSSKDGLASKYGLSGFEQLDGDLCEFQQALTQQTGLEVLIIYVDDGPSLARYGLRPVDASDARQVKKAVDHLDGYMNEQGREIRYLLIVGGDSIIPFHRLPNPIDDQDTDVPSDNPYASRDGNYFIPERAVGRMPDAEGEGVEFLRSLVRTAICGHQRPATPKGFWSTLLEALHPIRQEQQNGHSLGYSASIWRKASRAVFEVIGNTNQLRTCPPLAYAELNVPDGLRFSYFNLHGIEDGANWYGQRDSLFPADYPLFPVALRPQDVSASEHANTVVFTEACYGANVLGKDSENSLALRFLASRALALVGSTRVAYGAIAPPLLGADLIGRYFWEGLRAHLSVGEALKYARVNLVKEMQDRQGYLDGEDQKTLISFVLYGDPSLSATAVWSGIAQRTVGKTLCPPLICQRKARQQKSIVSDELIAAVKRDIEASLPHMAQARIHASPLAVCGGDCSHRCPLARGAAKAARAQRGNWTFTLEKDIVNGEGTHRQVVKATVDERGHILKMAVSK